MVKSKKTKAEISEILDIKNDEIFDAEIKEDLTVKQTLTLIRKLRKNPLKFNLNKELKKLLEKPEFYKAGMHSIDREKGDTTRPLIPFEDIQDRLLVESAKAYDIVTEGWDLTGRQSRGVHAFRKIYADNDYRLNWRGVWLVFTPEQWFEAYEIEKYLSKGNMIYPHSQTAPAIQTIWDLQGKHTINAYSRKVSKKESERIELLSTIFLEVVRIFKGLDEPNPTEFIKGAKLKYIAIKPSSVLVDQVEDYYVLENAKHYAELRKFGYEHDKYLSLFIRILRRHVTHQTRLGNPYSVIATEIGFTKLAYMLRMDAWIKKSAKSLIDKRLKEIIQRAKTMNKLNDYKIRKGKKDTIAKLFINSDIIPKSHNKTIGTGNEKATTGKEKNEATRRQKTGIKTRYVTQENDSNKGIFINTGDLLPKGYIESEPTQKQASKEYKYKELF